MKDIHSHLLPGIDDGSRTIEESIQLIKDASAAGVTDIMLTPHYIKDSEYVCNNKEKQKLFQELKKKVKDEKIDIHLYLGNEIYIDDELITLLNQNELMPLNQSKYVLVEFPLGNVVRNAKDIMYELVRNGYIPILAHPERYRVFKHHPDYIKEFLRIGVLLQGNYKSLFGSYGKEAKKTLKYFLKNNWISFLGSDVHRTSDFPVKRLKKKLKFLVKNDSIVEDLLVNNFDKVIHNLDIGIKG